MLTPFNELEVEDSMKLLVASYRMNEYPFVKAREGREKQRYDGEMRLVVGYYTSVIFHC